MKEVAINPQLLPDARAAIKKNQEANNQAAELGVAITKVFYALTVLGPKMQESEDAAREQIIRLCLANGVAAEQYAGIDIDRGMLMVKEAADAAS